eukprot:3241275-Pleurochrysis_carterae.AAC.5
MSRHALSMCMRLSLRRTRPVEQNGSASACRRLLVVFRREIAHRFLPGAIDMIAVLDMLNQGVRTFHRHGRTRAVRSHTTPQPSQILPSSGPLPDGATAAAHAEAARSAFS